MTEVKPETTIEAEEPRKLWGSHTMNAPWGLLKRLTTAVKAIEFFNPNHYARNCELLGRNPDPSEALSLMEFVQYLEATRAFGDRKPNFLRVAEIVNAMTREGILQNVGSYAGKARFFNDCFLFMFAGSQNVNRIKGQLWIAPALGPEFIYYTIGNGVVQITGKNDDGDVVAGSGTVLSQRVILTAKHVVKDMQVDRAQMFQGVRCQVGDEQVTCHKTQDVAIIRLEQSLTPVNGLIFHPPRVGHTVHVLGFPHIPLASSPALVMHSGEVTNQSIDLFEDQKTFLYSAITRPGDSGGPIVSQNGYLVGIATKDLSVERGEATFAPHYAGVDAITIVVVLTELGLDMRKSFENLE